MGARTLSVLDGVEWSALGVFGLVYAATFASARKGFVAPAELRARFRVDRTNARVAIMSDHVLPALVALVMDVNVRASSAAGTPTVLTDVDTISNTLESAGYLDRLEALSQLYFDYGRLDELLEIARRWARRKAWLAIAFAVALLPLIGRYGFELESISDGVFITGGLVAVILLTSAVFSWWQETTARNELSELCERYDEA